MNPSPGASERIALEAQAFAESIVSTVREPLLVLDESLRVVLANRSFQQTFRVPPEETPGTLIYELGNGQWDIPALRLLLEEIVPKQSHFDDFEVQHAFPAIGRKIMLLNARKLRRPGNNATMILLAFEDITERRQLEKALLLVQAQDRKTSLALQRPMLFQPNEDAFSGLMVQTAYAMASEEALVGGDFWDTFAFGDGQVALVLGDVMGHGLTSAVFTTELKYVMRAYIREHEHPARVLYHMNRYLCQSNRLFDSGLNTEGSDAPVCIALATIGMKTGEGTLSIAGMVPPLLARVRGTVEPLEMVGLPLGIESDQEYLHLDFRLQSGDTLLLTTDGITEARRGRDFLDTEGLIRLIGAGSDGTLKEMAETILRGAQAFEGGRLHDDASIVLVRRTTRQER